MSAPRRRRWIEVLRRTAGVSGEDERGSGAGIDDAALWGAHERASIAVAEAGAHAERVAAAVARMRPVIEGVSERASLVAARSEGLAACAARVIESFERLGVVALNAGLEGARLADPHARALLLLADEIRANGARGADAAEQLARAVDEIAAEASEVRRQLDRARGEGADAGQEAAQLSASTQHAHKALDDLGARLRKATGIDPETARLVALAGEHTRGLMTALSALATAGHGVVGLSALRPVIGPLSRLLGEIEERVPEDDERPEGGA